jgi:hypothetical protein
MWLELERVLVVVVARDRAVGARSARLEHRGTRIVGHSHVQPNAPRRIRGRQLVAAEIVDAHGERERRARDPRGVDRDARGSLAEIVSGLPDRGVELLRQRRDAELAAILVQDPEDERVPAAERVLRERRPLRAENRRDRHLLARRRHVAALAAARLAIFAVPPLLIRNLLGQLADHLAALVERGRVERVTGRAELRLAHVCRFRLRELRRRAHHRFASGVHRVRAVDRSRPESRAAVDVEAAIEALVLAEIVRFDLMTHRARHTVEREAVRRRGRDDVREHLATLAARDGVETRHRHVAGRALVLDRRLRARVIRDLPTHSGVPIRVASGVRHHRRAPVVADRHVLAARRVQAAVTSDAAIRRDERGRLLRLSASEHRQRGERAEHDHEDANDSQRH